MKATVGLGEVAVNPATSIQVLGLHIDGKFKSETYIFSNSEDKNGVPRTSIDWGGWNLLGSQVAKGAAVIRGRCNVRNDRHMQQLSGTLHLG